MDTSGNTKMSIERKAKAYDEALERARKMLNMILDNELLGFPDQIREIFPQLCESEDERIRKEIIECIETLLKAPGASPRLCDWLAWLEKQKYEYAVFEPVESTLEYKMGFKAGRDSEKQKELPLMNGDSDAYFDEWNLQQHNPTKRQCFEEGMRYAQRLQKEHRSVSYSPLCNTIKDKIREYVANNFVTDTIVKTDVKSIVKAMEEGVRLGKEEQKLLKVGENAYFDPNTERWFIKKEQKPVEGITQDEIEQAMKTLTDFKVFAAKEAKQYNISHQRDIDWHNFCASLLTYLEVNNPVEWSEEDEKIRQSIIKDIEFERNYTFATTGKVIEKYDEQVKWLKCLSLNLKKRNEAVDKLCSNEWNEEDEKMLDDIISRLEDLLEDSGRTNVFKVTIQSDIDWLKFLRPHWKPSKEQMDALKGAVNDSIMLYDSHGSPLKEEVTRTYSENLQSLYEQLKKL